MPLSSNAVTVLTYFLTIVVKLKHLFLIFGCIVKAHYYEISQLSKIKLKSGKVKILSGMKQKLSLFDITVLPQKCYILCSAETRYLSYDLHTVHRRRIFI
jgi:hypothetical protein